MQTIQNLRRLKTLSNTSTNYFYIFSYKRLSHNVKPVKLAHNIYENSKFSNDKYSTPLIVKHGLFGSKSNWNSLCKAYHRNTHRKIIAVDARNHGDSPHTADHTYEHMSCDLKALLEELHLEKASFLGHSMGGKAVMYFALKYPEFVDKLLVADVSPVSVSPNLDTSPKLLNILRNINMPSNVNLSKAKVQVEGQLIERVRDKGLRNFLLTNLIQKSDGKYGWRINLPALMKYYNTNLARFPDVTDLKFEGNVLFIAGGDSDFVQKNDHPKILTMFPQAEFRYIEGAGHWLHSDKPTEFLQITTEFLNR